ncbi:hypothetical protein LJC42_08240 [Eubacteriales bacterium OttesenSCG-928-K08]|nr:hypothetical protein [Eubacteriales bacterium OttesenSCG-928-K08]
MNDINQKNWHSGVGDIITGGNVNKTYFHTQSHIDYEKLSAELQLLLRKGCAENRISHSDGKVIDDALTAAEKKDSSAVARALKSLTKYSIDFAKELSLKYLVSLLIK